MKVYEVGRICLKIAGRDAGRKCVVVETIDDRFVVVDGNVRRKKINVKHLEPLTEIIEIKDKAAHEEVKTAFEKLGIAVWEKKSKKVPARQKKQKKKKLVKEEKSKKKKVKKVGKVKEDSLDVKEPVTTNKPTAEKSTVEKPVEEIKAEEAAPKKEVVEEPVKKA